MSRISIKRRFRLGAAAILFFFCMAAALMEYSYLRHEYLGVLREKTTLFMAMAQSSRDYVKEILRPRMQQYVADDRFILEAMSTSFVSREIMNRLHTHFPEFTYKRAALNPRNPINLADAFESEKILWFGKNQDQTEWKGVLQKSGHSFFVHMIPVRVEKECLSCHGFPETAPDDLLKIYGRTASFHYEVGDVVAAESLYIPMDLTLARIQEKAWAIFFVTALSLVFLLVFFYLLFHRTVILNLRDILNSFRQIRDETPDEEESLGPAEKADEAEQIQEHLLLVAKKLKRVHQDLQKSEAKYKELFENAPEAILVSRNGMLLDINRTGLRLFAFENKEEALGIESVYQLFWDGQEAGRLWDTLRKNHRIQDLEIRIVNRKGEKRDVLLSALARPKDTSQIPDFEATLRDITEKKAMDAGLAQADKLTSIGQLAAGVAHEINNPLGVIQLYAGLIEKGCSGNPQILEDIRIIQKHTDTCKQVVESLLDFSRNAPPLKKQMDMHQALEEILQVLSREMQSQNLRLIRNLAPDMPKILADARQMKQVWMNLLLNAIQATEPGGHIEVRSFTEKGQALFQVKDTGHGISQRNRNRIFEPFFTTRADKKGTGLGLSVVYGIISHHGGEISVKSSPGEGSTFTLCLPLETPS
ncbi:DUF3365 domain-containing protein [Desulfobotulus sp.]|jgi:PAS domain S-box-containing protein|uniref:c-type heme family protein n=1 Tax=Desulfobotulus sp. TaxID=1940337 RepID=UPI002A35C3B2|nr:DUF3365 domain-containing protein [Desulfobotulus sp.]MDY0161674.1 DUF3365 domain-containing protein [Desulfobotulus sp.]